MCFLFNTVNNEPFIAHVGLCSHIYCIVEVNKTLNSPDQNVEIRYPSIGVKFGDVIQVNRYEILTRYIDGNYIHIQLKVLDWDLLFRKPASQGNQILLN